MPVDLRIDTDGKTEDKKIEVVAQTRPLPLKLLDARATSRSIPTTTCSPIPRDVKLRASILRGQALQQQGDLAGALAEFNKALDLNKNSSLAHYRIAEVFFLQRNYQSSANSYRESHQRRRRAALDRGLEPHPAGQNFRHHRPARARHQRIPAGHSDQRRHLRALSKKRAKYLQKAYERPRKRAAVKLKAESARISAPLPPDSQGWWSSSARGQAELQNVPSQNLTRMIFDNRPATCRIALSCRRRFCIDEASPCALPRKPRSALSANRLLRDVQMQPALLGSICVDHQPCHSGAQSPDARYGLLDHPGEFRSVLTPAPLPQTALALPQPKTKSDPDGLFRRMSRTPHRDER